MDDGERRKIEKKDGKGTHKPKWVSESVSNSRNISEKGRRELGNVWKVIRLEP